MIVLLHSSRLVLHRSNFTFQKGQKSSATGLAAGLLSLPLVLLFAMLLLTLIVLLSSPSSLPTESLSLLAL